MANTVNKAAIYNSILDEVIEAGLTSAPIAAGASRIRYNGGNTVKLAKLSVDGYSNYDRATGYPSGDAVQSWEDHLISQDRGITFNVDVMDEDETLQTLSATNIIAEFGRTRAVPELDSYRYSAIFQAIVDDATVRYGYYTPAEATVLGTLQGNIADIQNVIGEQEPLVCFISGAAYKFLTQSTQLSKNLETQSVTGTNGVTTKFYSVDGVRLIPVPSARMKTEYAFGTKGFTAKAWAQDMNWILMSPNAAVAFVKHQKMKIVSAEDNQTADAEKVMARQYHDCWVYENKHNAIYVSLKVATAPTIDALGGDVDNEADNMEITLGDAFTNRDTGHKFYYLDTNSQTAPTAPKVYDEIDLTSYTEITVATEVNVTIATDDYGVVVAVDENGRVIGYTAIKVV
jgi:hypothetical protein